MINQVQGSGISTEQQKKNWLINWYFANDPMVSIYLATLRNPSLVSNYQTSPGLLYGSTFTQSMENYFIKIKTIFGQSMFDQLVTEFAQQSNLYVDEIKVDEPCPTTGGWHLYGSCRLGVYEANRLISKRVARDINLDNQITSNEYVIETPEEVTYLFSSYQLERGAKRYELANHLGNVLTVISDKKTAICTGNTFNYFAAERISATDYSPFGAPLAGRTCQASEYRFSYNRGEAINEVYGKDNYVDLGERGADTRLGRLNWSIDPRAAEYPWQSPYAYYANSPIWQIDFKGGGKSSTHTDKDGRVLAVYNDGDKGIYKHDEAKSKEDIDKKYSEGNTSAGGTKMGVSLHMYSFVDEKSLTEENIKNNKLQANGKIDFGSQWAKENVNKVIWGMQGKSLFYYAFHARSSPEGGPKNKFDIKRNRAKTYNDLYRGSLLYGNVYCSDRDAGNFAAGIIQNRSILPNYVTSVAFGAYNNAGLVGLFFLSPETYFLNSFPIPFGPSPSLSAPYFGEDLGSGLAQEAGRNYKKDGYLSVD